jgi:IS30 family transposase
MAKNKHLTLDDRIEIAGSLGNRESFKEIGKKLDKDCTTISKEVRSHLVFKKVGGLHVRYNACARRRECKTVYLCETCTEHTAHHKCSLCIYCNDRCPEFVLETCQCLEEAPYVCNGCVDRTRCSLENASIRRRRLRKSMNLSFPSPARGFQKQKMKWSISILSYRLCS